MHRVSPGRKPDVPPPPQSQIHIPEAASPGKSLAHDWLPTWQRLVVISLLFALFVFCSSLAVDYILLVHRDSPVATVGVAGDFAEDVGAVPSS